MIDIEKLTPLDPGNWVCKKFADDGEKISVEMTHADWDMCCKARRALEAMIRHGLGAKKSPSDSHPSNAWQVAIHWGWDRVHIEYAPDPFTAICAAEEWLKSQEKK